MLLLTKLVQCLVHASTIDQSALGFTVRQSSINVRPYQRTTTTCRRRLIVVSKAFDKLLTSLRSHCAVQFCCSLPIYLQARSKAGDHVHGPQRLGHTTCFQSDLSAPAQGARLGDLGRRVLRSWRGSGYFGTQI